MGKQQREFMLNQVREGHHLTHFGFEPHVRLFSLKQMLASIENLTSNYEGIPALF